MTTRSSVSYTAWVENSMCRVYPGAAAPARPRGATRLALAAGEAQSFQIVVRPAPGVTLRGGSVELTSLAGSTQIPAANIEWQLVGFIRFRNADYPPIRDNIARALAEGAQVPGWWPDPLLPVARFDVPQERAQALWITVHAPPDAAPGRCAGTVVIRFENAPPVRVPLAVTVWPFALPPGAGHFLSAFGLLDDQLRRVYGRLDRAMIRQWGDFILRHRINPDNIYRADPPDVADLEHFLAGGMNAYNVIYNFKNREDSAAVLGDGSPAHLDKIPSFLAALARSPYFHELLDRAYYYGFDEVTRDRLAPLQAEFRRVREQFGLPTMTTSHVPQTPADLRRLNVDWLCPISSWLDAAKVARCRAAGFKLWTYVSLEPDPPYANLRMDCPLIESRVLPWQVCHAQLDGFLYWAFNAWRSPGNDRPIDPNRDGPLLEWDATSYWEADGKPQSWLHGDGRLLYPGVAGPIGSQRLANLRDGIQDHEYLWLLAERTGRPADAVEAAAAITADWKTFTRDPATIENARAAIARRIARAAR